MIVVPAEMTRLVTFASDMSHLCPGSVALRMLLQLPKAYSEIFVAAAGIVTLVKPLQPKNAYSPMLDTELPIIASLMPLHLKNAR